MADIDFKDFRNFVLKQNPNLNQKQLDELDDFILNKQATDLVQQGKLDPGKIPANKDALKIIVGAGGTSGYLSDEEKAKQNALNSLERLATEIKAMAQSGKNVSGMGTGRFKEEIARGKDSPIIGGLYKFLFDRGSFTQDVDKLRSLASHLTSQVAFGEGGKAFTETEKSLLAGKIPDLDVRRDRPGLLGLIPGFEERGVTGAVLDTEEELVTKMDQLLWAIAQKRAGREFTSIPDFGAEDVESIREAK